MESRYYEACMSGSYGDVRALDRYSRSPVRAVGRWLEKTRSTYVAETDGQKVSPSQHVCENNNRCFLSGTGRHVDKSGVVQRRLFLHTHVHPRFFPLRVCRAGQRQTRAHRIGGIREDICRSHTQHVAHGSRIGILERASTGGFPQE
jgi:hypothetical protein